MLILPNRPFLVFPAFHFFPTRPPPLNSCGPVAPKFQVLSRSLKPGFFPVSPVWGLLLSFPILSPQRRFLGVVFSCPFFPGTSPATRQHPPFRAVPPAPCVIEFFWLFSLLFLPVFSEFFPLSSSLRPLKLSCAAPLNNFPAPALLLHGLLIT